MSVDRDTLVALGVLAIMASFWVVVISLLVAVLSFAVLFSLTLMVEGVRNSDPLMAGLGVALMAFIGFMALDVWLDDVGV